MGILILILAIVAVILFVVAGVLDKSPARFAWFGLAVLSVILAFLPALGAR